MRLRYSTLCPTGPVLRTFVQYLTVFCSRLGADSEVIFSSELAEPIVLDKRVKFCDPSLTIVEKFYPRPSEAVFSTVFSL